MSEQEQHNSQAPGRAAPFEKAFHDRLDNIVERGKVCGLTMTDICRESGVARATPDRWKAKLPKTIELVDKMEAVVVKAEQAKSKQ